MEQGTDKLQEVSCEASPNPGQIAAPLFTGWWQVLFLETFPSAPQVVVQSVHSVQAPQFPSEKWNRNNWRKAWLDA